MKERPILFSGPMVRAILEGRKTQTRRIVKPQPTECLPHTKYLEGEEIAIHYARGYRWRPSKNWEAYTREGEKRLAELMLSKCPYGKPGDRLWCRETWQVVHFSRDPETGHCDDYWHSKDIPPANTDYWTVVYEASSGFEDNREDRGFPWRPSIHMPRWASRITLEITGIRVERLQEISEEDAKAEGVDSIECCVSGDPEAPHEDRYVAGFHHLWESINGPGSWEANPWVWVVEFRRLQ